MLCRRVASLRGLPQPSNGILPAGNVLLDIGVHSLPRTHQLQGGGPGGQVNSALGDADCAGQIQSSVQDLPARRKLPISQENAFACMQGLVTLDPPLGAVAGGVALLLARSNIIERC